MKAKYRVFTVTAHGNEAHTTLDMNNPFADSFIQLHLNNNESVSYFLDDSKVVTIIKKPNYRYSINGQIVRGKKNALKAIFDLLNIEVETAEYSVEINHFDGSKQTVEVISINHTERVMKLKGNMWLFMSGDPELAYIPPMNSEKSNMFIKKIAGYGLIKN